MALAYQSRLWLCTKLVLMISLFGLSSAKSRTTSFAARIERFRVTASIRRVVIWHQTRYNFPSGANVGVTILGCTLFSRVVPEQAREVVDRFVDLKDIIEWDVEDHTERHQADVQWLNHEVEKISEADPEPFGRQKNQESKIRKEHCRFGVYDRPQRSDMLEKVDWEVVGIWPHALQCRFQR
ncbi:hypothetical protein HO173_005503 [Letharia columbiana]|uniref:Uncharacterized protein n=1 Tax=Letharia columbiana TaxID=112416 RepID=A0A8H6L5M8_9LECA|nr:uncharacterized protein HO173_005503 [Letharia columbiana]KAF6236411.1 hypothetical protein HO173_005503 [Letharia columbiana]